jgi:hypothetical protein
MTDETRADKGSVAGSSLPGEILDPIAIGSVYGIAGQPSSLANLAYANSIITTNLTQQNSVANQQAMNEVGESVLGKTVNLVANLNPLEAVATTKLDTGNDVAQQVIDLKAAVEGFTGKKVKPARIVPPPFIPPILEPQPNPNGGVIVRAASSDFPITLAFKDDRASAPTKASGGSQVLVDDSSFPVEILILGEPSSPIGITANVSRLSFPFTVDIDRREGGPVKEESSEGASTLLVPTEDFPVQIKLRFP